MQNFLKFPRFWLAGPAAFLLAVMVMLGMSIWFPKGAAELDNLVLPMIAFPLIWAVMFFYAYLNHSIKRIGLVFAAVAVVHIALLAYHFMSGG